MKVSASKVAAFVRAPDPEARAVLLYGPDSGLVRERADALARLVVDDLGDPFRVAELTPERLKDDPARLADEAAALAMTGGRRVVRLRPASESQADLLKGFLAAPLGDALVLVEAGDLAKRSRLRQVFEAARTGAALPCYPDDDADLRRLIEETLAPLGFNLEPDALRFLAAVLGGDRLMTRRELDKLAVYMGAERRVTLADAEACVGDSSVLTLDGVAIAACAGNLAALERGVARAYLEGAVPVAVLRAMARHLHRLHRTAGALARGETIDRAFASFHPRLHFKIEKALRAQRDKWPARRVARAMEIVLDAERGCKTTGMPAEALCGHALMRVALAARAAGGRTRGRS